MPISKKHLIPAAWLTVSAAAFWSGRVLRPDYEAGESPQPASIRTAEIAGEENAARSGHDRPFAHATSTSRENARHATRAQGAGKSRSLSSADIAGMIHDYRTATDPLKRREAFQALLSGMTKENAAAIRKEMGELSADDPDFRDFHFAMGKVAGLDAVMVGVSTDVPDMGPTLAGWAASDPAAAAAWFRNANMKESAFDPLIKGHGMSPEQIRRNLAAPLVVSLSHSDPALAQAITTTPDANGHTLPGIVKAVALDVVQNLGTEGARQWAQNLPVSLGEVSYQRPDGQYEMENVRDAAIRNVALTYARTEPLAAAEWAVTNTNPSQAPWVMREITVDWAKQAPVEAATWVEAQNFSRGRQESLSGVYSEWAAKDPMPASEHLASMPAGDARDAAIAGLTRVLAREDPEASMAWAQQISDPAARRSAEVQAERLMTAAPESQPNAPGRSWKQ